MLTQLYVEIVSLVSTAEWDRIIYYRTFVNQLFNKG